MARMDGSWLRQGFFVVGEGGFMRAVRDNLEQARKVRRGSLRIYSHPAAAVWKHTYWWREGKTMYAEAQAFARIAREYPVLAVGVAVEKGYELPGKRVHSTEQLNRKTWDWPRLVKHLDVLLSRDVPACAKALGEPVTLRITTKSRSEPDDGGWYTRAFSRIKGRWFQRYVGFVKDDDIADYLRTVDKQRDCWAIVHFAYDIGPAEADRLTASDVTDKLMSFETIRRRLRGEVRRRRGGGVKSRRQAL